MNDDDSRCIHIERDGKTIEFGDLNIPTTDRNTSYADGLVGILTVILVVLGCGALLSSLNGPDNLDTTFVGNLQTVWNFRIICIHA